MSPREYGEHLASVVAITDEQAMEFARILLADAERVAA